MCCMVCSRLFILFLWVILMWLLSLLLVMLLVIEMVLWILFISEWVNSYISIRFSVVLLSRVIMVRVVEVV